MTHGIGQVLTRLILFISKTVKFLWISNGLFGQIKNFKFWIRFKVKFKILTLNDSDHLENDPRPPSPPHPPLGMLERWDRWFYTCWGGGRVVIRTVRRRRIEDWSGRDFALLGWRLNYRTVWVEAVSCIQYQLSWQRLPSHQSTILCRCGTQSSLQFKWENKVWTYYWVWMRSSRVWVWDLAECGWDLAEWWERLAAHASVATVLG